MQQTSKKEVSLLSKETYLLYQNLCLNTNKADTFDIEATGFPHVALEPTATILFEARPQIKKALIGVHSLIFTFIIIILRRALPLKVPFLPAARWRRRWWRGTSSHACWIG